MLLGVRELSYLQIKRLSAIFCIRIWFETLARMNYSPPIGQEGNNLSSRIF